MRSTEQPTNRGEPMKPRGYTLIELLVTMVIIALLLTLAAPRYFGQVDKAKEDVLREDLYLMRDAIDKYFMDRGRYPDQLEDLVTHKYLRAIPVEPYTGSRTTWVIEETTDGTPGNVFNVRTPTRGKGRDGSDMQEW
jgi:general secretion pathway protein G